MALLCLTLYLPLNQLTAHPRHRVRLPPRRRRQIQIPPTRCRIPNNRCLSFSRTNSHAHSNSRRVRVGRSWRGSGRGPDLAGRDLMEHAKRLRPKHPFRARRDYGTPRNAGTGADRYPPLQTVHRRAHVWSARLSSATTTLSRDFFFCRTAVTVARRRVKPRGCPMRSRASSKQSPTKFR